MGHFLGYTAWISAGCSQGFCDGFSRWEKPNNKRGNVSARDMVTHSKFCRASLSDVYFYLLNFGLFISLPGVH